MANGILPSVLVNSPGAVIAATNDVVEGASHPLVNAPAFNEAFSLEWQLSYVDSGEMGDSVTTIAILTGIVAVANVTTIHDDESVTISAWNGMLNFAGTWTQATPHLVQVQYDGAGTISLLIDGIEVDSASNTPGPGVPDTFSLTMLKEPTFTVLERVALLPL